MVCARLTKRSKYQTHETARSEFNFKLVFFFNSDTTTSSSVVSSTTLTHHQDPHNTPHCAPSPSSSKTWTLPGRARTSSPTTPTSCAATTSGFGTQTMRITLPASRRCSSRIPVRFKHGNLKNKTGY